MATLASVPAAVVYAGVPAGAQVDSSVTATPIPSTTVLPSPTLPDRPPPPTSLPTASPGDIGAPGNLHVETLKSTSVTLAWTAATPGRHPIAHYELFYYQAFDDVVVMNRIDNVTSHTVTGLRPATEYTFSLSAYDESGDSSGTSRIEVLTPATDVGPDTTPPSEPGPLILIGTTATTAQLRWSPSTDNLGVTGYTVYGFDGWFGSTVRTTVTGTSATVPLDSRFKYLYVRARDAAGNLSPSTNTVTVPTPTSTTPPPPPPPPPATCAATYRTSGEWPGGFVSEVTLTNNGKAPISGWTLRFSFGGDQQIDSSWSSSFQQTGREVKVEPAAWNRTIGVGETLRFGMLGHWSRSNAPPSAISVNGVACATT
ncbi:MAG TPA: cellulose binding domain-containing protein [Actinoplanes sp.]|nr:cellulose binding domain-containing protein [Actinoplanes sp.]